MVDKNGTAKRYDVFVSYTRADVEKASRVVKALESVGYHVWWDSYIQGGSSFTQEIEKALTECAAVIVLWSNKSKDSLFVQNEAHFANNHNKQIPLVIEEIELPLQVLSLHVIKLIDWKGSVKTHEFQKIVEAIEITKQKNSEPENPPLPPPTPVKSKRWLRPLLYLLGSLFLIGLATWMNSYRVTHLNPKSLVMGIMLRKNWDICQTKQVYSSIALRMNQILEQGKNKDLGFTDNILTYTSYEKLSEDLHAGKIDIAGELSPYQIYRLHQKSAVVPYISPNYAGKDTYKAVLFTTAENSDWNTLITKLSTDPETKIALFNKTSTAGYWYPKYLLSHDITSDREITDILLPKSSYDDVYTAVKHQFEGVIVGAMAEFKHCKRNKNLTETECKKIYSVVAHTSAIPNGGFVISETLNDYLETKNYKGLLQRMWSTSTADTLNDGLVTEATQLCESTTANVHIKKYLEGNWTRVTLENYSGAFEVFED